MVVFSVKSVRLRLTNNQSVCPRYPRGTFFFLLRSASPSVRKFFLFFLPTLWSLCEVVQSADPGAAQTPRLSVTLFLSSFQRSDSEAVRLPTPFFSPLKLKTHCVPHKRISHRCSRIISPFVAAHIDPADDFSFS